MTEWKEIETSLRWYRKLSRGETVFGKKKDRLIRDIVLLGGMRNLIEQCGLSLSPEGKRQTATTDVTTLLEIKQRLQKEASPFLRSLCKRLGIPVPSGAVSGLELTTRIKQKFDVGPFHFNYKQDAESMINALFTPRTGHR
jgi:hypothetical protein